MGNILKSLKFMIDTANDNTKGYDQAHRNSPNFDCSSLLGTALNKGGFPVATTSWTGNLLPQLLNSGFKQIGINEPRQAGDVFLTPGKHTVMCVDANNIVHASINEKGTVTGGLSGDQTGKEICVRDFYTIKGGWKYHLRYSVGKTNEELAREVIRGNWGNGSARKKNLENAGYDFKAIQKIVNKMLRG